MERIATRPIRLLLFSAEKYTVMTQENCSDCPHLSSYERGIACPSCDLKVVSDLNRSRWALSWQKGTDLASFWLLG